MSSAPPLPCRKPTRKCVHFLHSNMRKILEFSSARPLCIPTIHAILCCEFSLSLSSILWLVQHDVDFDCDYIVPLLSLPSFDDLVDGSEYQVRWVDPERTEKGREEGRIEREAWAVEDGGEEEGLHDGNEGCIEINKGNEEEGEQTEVAESVHEYNDSGEAYAELSEDEAWENEKYFGEYGRLPIHVGMLADKRRNFAYYEAISSLAADVIRGGVVLDVGCGTGVLSCMCAKAGAARVYAVEASPMADYAEKVFQKGNFGDTVTLFRGRIEDVTLPSDVDVIVSEWMGCFLYFESMWASVLVARDRYLKKGGLLLPSHATLHAAPVDFSEYLGENVSVFDDVCGVDLSPLLPAAVENACKNAIKSKSISLSCVLAPPQTIHHIDLRTARKEDIERHLASFQFSFPERKNFDGIAVWFDVTFSRRSVEEWQREGHKPGDMSPLQWNQRSSEMFHRTSFGDIVFSTSPQFGSTHWGQDIFLFTDIFPLEDLSKRRKDCLEGEVEKESGGGRGGGESESVVEGTIEFSQNRFWKRHWDVAFSFTWKQV